MSAKIILPNAWSSFFWWGLHDRCEQYVKWGGDVQKRVLKDCLLSVPGKKARREVFGLCQRMVVKMRDEKRNGRL